MTLEALEQTPFTTLLGDIVQNKRSLQLDVVTRELRRTLYFALGDLVLADSSRREESFPAFLAKRGILDQALLKRLGSAPALELVSAVHEKGFEALTNKLLLLREWLISMAMPFFDLDEGNVVITDDGDVLEPEKRILLHSNSAWVIQGARAMTSGLVIRRSLGDLKRRINLVRNAEELLPLLPLEPREREMTATLTEPVAVDAFLRRFGGESLSAARVVIGLSTLGIMRTIEEPKAQLVDSETERDLALLATIGSGDPRSIQVIGLARQLPHLTHYEVLEVPRTATRNQVMMAGESKKRLFEENTYPAAVRQAVAQVRKRVEEAATTLSDNARKQGYDRILKEVESEDNQLSIEQRIVRRTMAESNFRKAVELFDEEDFFGAIILLKQAVGFAPEHTRAWLLLGKCQAKNPRWLRDAAESYHRALNLDPAMPDAMMALGDLYRSQGLISRAQSCYEDALQIDPENAEAKMRLRPVKK